MNWEEAYFETLAKLQQEIIKNMKLKEEIARLRWEAHIQDQIDICSKLLYNTYYENQKADKNETTQPLCLVQQGFAV